VRLIVTSDTHLYEFRQFAKTLEGGINSRLKQSLDVLDMIIERANQEADLFIHVGDLYHEKGRTSLKVVYESFKVLRKLMKPSIWVSGNHDMVFRTTGKYTVLDLLEFVVPQSYVDREVIDFEGYKFVCVPYNFDREEHSETIYSIEDKENVVLLTHADMKDVMYGGYKSEVGLEKESLSEFLFAIVGHCHTPYFLENNVLIPGAPVQHTWNDVGEERGYWVVELNNGQLEGVEFCRVSNVSKFVEVNLEENPDFEFNDRDFYRVICSSPVEIPEGVNAVVITPEVEAEEKRLEVASLSSPESLIDKYVELKAKERKDELKELGMILLKGEAS